MKVFSRIITVKLDRVHAEKLARVAKKRAVSQSDVVRAALDAIPDEDQASSLAAVADLIGAFAGPRDLSTSSKHLEGFGHDRRRHRSSRRAS